jgi:hypothetical protein
VVCGDHSNPDVADLIVWANVKMCFTPDDDVVISFYKVEVSQRLVQFSDSLSGDRRIHFHGPHLLRSSAVSHDHR